MGVHQLVIVGRPNVGKSSLFNWLVGHRVAIVDPAAGVTRDRVTHLAQIYDRFLARERFIEVVDTGGMGIEDVDKLTDQIQQQIDMALESADLILMVVDTRAGVTPLDEEVARRLRYVSVPVFCVANKTDTPELENQAHEFYRLGRKVIAVSAEQKRGKSELVDAICERLPPPLGEEVFVEEPLLKVAIAGRRNTGKSTLVNTLAQAERMIVSEVPGTTRDSVDVRFELDGKAFIAIDTPGFRRERNVYTNVDFYGTHRAQRSIRRADVVLLFLDASQRISKVDKQLCEYVAQQYKPCIFVVNKWDLVADTISTERWVGYLRDTFRTMPYVPIAFIVGQHGQEREGPLGAHPSGLRPVAEPDSHRGAEPGHPRGAGALAAAALRHAPAEDLLRHAGGLAAAHDRHVLQRSARDLVAVPAVPAGRAPRPAHLQRGADQAVPAQAGIGRHAGRDRRQARQGVSAVLRHPGAAEVEQPEELLLRQAELAAARRRRRRSCRTARASPAGCGRSAPRSCRA